jgi:6-phosphofructokinase 1
VAAVEVMGREAGWIATYAGIAAGADAILVPERPYDLDAVCELLWARHANGTTYSIVVVAEAVTPKGGAASVATAHTDAFGHARLGGVAVSLSAEIEERTSVAEVADLLRGLGPWAGPRDQWPSPDDSADRPTA